MTSPLSEHAPWQAISPSWGAARRVAAFVLTLIALVLASGVLLLADAGRWWWTAIVGAIAALGIFHIANSGRVGRARQYAETADELLERHGLLSRSTTIVPYGRLQSVNVTQGPFERLMGLSAVKLQTASLATSAVVRGLEQADAHALAHRLTVRAKERQWSQ